MQQAKKDQFSSKPQANRTVVDNTMHMFVLPYNVMNIDKQVKLTSIELVAQQAKAKRGERASFFQARAERNACIHALRAETL